MAILINNNYAPPIDNHDGGVVNVIVGEVAQAPANAQTQDWPEDLIRTEKTFSASVPVSRLEKLYYMLLKFKLIAEDTSQKSIVELFDGEPSDCVVRWIAPEAALVYFISQLRKKKYIDTSTDDHWVIVRNHFRDKDNAFFRKNIRQATPPEKYKDTIKRMVDILNPTATAWENIPTEEFILKIDEFNDNGIRIHNRRH